MTNAFSPNYVSVLPPEPAKKGNTRPVTGAYDSADHKVRQAHSHGAKLHTTGKSRHDVIRRGNSFANGAKG